MDREVKKIIFAELKKTIEEPVNLSFEEIIVLLVFYADGFNKMNKTLNEINSHLEKIQAEFKKSLVIKNG
jgi:hypothetical protein